MLTISSGDSCCVICPELGGSIASWSVNGQNMLRRANEATIAAGDPLQLSSFPLVPYSNRIGFAAFEWKGRTIGLEPNFLPEPHAIHGVGWKRPWQIEAHEQSRCTLRLDHAADAHWPWPFTATQTIALSDNGLTLSLSATNLAKETAPMAFGHHPYFDQSGASLSFAATHVYMSDADFLPEQAIRPDGQFDFSTCGTVAGRDVDHCYAGWSGQARIKWEDRPYLLDIEADMPCAVVYIPDGGAAFCFEPVPHINNALNRPEEQPAMASLSPGAQFSGTIKMQAKRVTAA